MEGLVPLPPLSLSFECPKGEKIPGGPRGFPRPICSPGANLPGNLKAQGKLTPDPAFQTRGNLGLNWPAYGPILLAPLPPAGGGNPRAPCPAPGDEEHSGLYREEPARAITQAMEQIHSRAYARERRVRGYAHVRALVVSLTEKRYGSAGTG